LPAVWIGVSSGTPGMTASFRFFRKSDGKEIAGGSVSAPAGGKTACSSVGLDVKTGDGFDVRVKVTGPPGHTADPFFGNKRVQIGGMILVDASGVGEKYLGGMQVGADWVDAAPDRCEIAGPPPECIEGSIEVLETCPDGVTWKRRRVCQAGKWVYQTQTCPVTPPPPPPPPPPPSIGRGKIWGQVYSAVDGFPVKEGKVTGSGPESWEAIVEDGAYYSESLFPGDYLVGCSCPGFDSQTKGVSLAHDSIEKVDFALIPGPVKAEIKGKVTNSVTGELISTGRVVGSGPTPFDVEIVDGNYDSGTLDPGSYSLQFSATGYKTKTTSVVVTAGEVRTLDFQLEPEVGPTPADIHGYVRDKNTKQGIEGATVSILPPDILRTTDPMGRYEFKPLDPGDYTLTASHANYSPEEKTATVTAEGSVTLDFDLESLGPPAVGPCAKVGEGLPWPFNVVARALCESFYSWAGPVVEALGGIKLPEDFEKNVATSLWELLPDWLKAAIDSGKTVADGVSVIGHRLFQKRASEPPPGTINYNEEPGLRYQPRSQENAGVGLFGGIAREMARALLGDFQEQAPGLVEAAKVVVSPTSPEWKKDLDEKLTGFKDSVYKSIVTPIGDLEKTHSPMTMEEALKWAPTIAAAGLGAVTTAFLADVAGEFATLGQVEAFGKGAREIIRYTGIRRMASQIVTAPIAQGIMPWVGRHFDRAFRTHIFERDLADELFIRGEIDEKTWKLIYEWYGFTDTDIKHIQNELRIIPPTRLADQMLFHKEISLEKWQLIYSKSGWRDEHRDAWQKAMWTNPSDRLISTMLEVAQEEKPWFTEKLTNRGYTAEDAQKLISIFNKLATRDELKGVMTELVTEFADGFSSESDLTSALNKLQRPKEEITTRVDLAKLKAEKSKRSAERKLLREKFVKLVIQEAEYRAGLEKLGMQKDRIEIEVQLAKLDRKDSVERALTKADQESLFRFDIIDEAKYRDRLLGMGFDPAEVDDLVALAKKRKIPTAPEAELALTKAEIGALFVSNLKSEEWARSKLDSRGYTSEEIEDLILLWRSRIPQGPLPPDAALTKGDLEALFIAKLKPEEWIRSELVTRGYNAQEIQDLIDLWTSRLPRQPAAPEAALTKGEIESLFISGQKSESWTREQLVAKGYDPTEIEDLLLLWRTRLPRESPAPEAALSKDDILTLASLGMIEDLDFDNELRRKGYDSVDIDYLHDLATVKAISDERLKLRTQAEYDYLDGFISYELLMVNLDALGFRPDEVQMFASAAKQKLDRDHKRELLKTARTLFRGDAIDEETFTKYMKEGLLLQEWKIKLILEEDNLRRTAKTTKR